MALPIFMAVDFFVNDLGPPRRSSFVIWKSSDHNSLFFHKKIIESIRNDFLRYHKKIHQTCIHIFFDIEAIEKNEKIYSIRIMSDYITNSKNRKLKTKFLLFLSRINIWAGKLPLSWRLILLMEGVLWVSLFFPWFHLE